MSYIVVPLDPWSVAMCRASRHLAGALLAGLGMGCAPSPWDADPAETGEGTLEASTQRALQDVLTEGLGEFGLVGAQAAIVAPSGDWRGVAGTSDWGRARDLTHDDQLCIASVSKTYTAALVMQAVDEDVLALDDTLSTWAPFVPNADAITVKQLLAHEAGLPELWGLGGLATTAALDGSVQWSTEDLMRIIADGEPAFDPGTDFAYSNANYTALAYILESAFERPLHTLVETRIAEGIGGDATTSAPGGRTPRRVIGHDRGQVFATGYEHRIDNVSWVSGAVGGGSIVSTADEVARFGHALASASLVSEASRDAMIDLHPQNDYGFGVGRFEDGDREVWGHNGMLPGYRNVLFHDPASGVTVAVLSNTTTGGDNLHAEAIAWRMLEVMAP